MTATLFQKCKAFAHNHQLHPPSQNTLDNGGRCHLDAGAHVFRLNFGRRPSQNPQKLTLAALKFGVGNVKNRRFQLGLVCFLPGFYRNTHREPLNTTTKGFGLEPQRSTGLVFGLKSDSRQYQLVYPNLRTTLTNGNFEIRLLF